MRILVALHWMELGGSQLNALELAARARQAGHEVLLFAPDGVLVPRAIEWGLEYHRAPDGGAWPSARNLRDLIELVRGRRVDVVHGYEREAALELAYGPHLRLGTPMVITILSMDLATFLPKRVPLVVGTRELADSARGRHLDVTLMEPPIDTEANAPSGDSRAARQRFGVGDEELLVTVVGRMTVHLEKALGVLEAVTVVGELVERFPVRLLVVGEGPELARVRDAATAVNRRTGRETVVVTGGLLDPRPAYDAADIVLGMGSSALKGLSFGKPLVVQGATGFWEVLTPGSAPTFLHQGFMGHGSGDGVGTLGRLLDPLLAEAEARDRLGAFGRSLVLERFSLTDAATRQDQLYRRAAERTWSPAERVQQLAGPAAGFAAYGILKKSALRVLPDARGARLRQRFAPMWQVGGRQEPTGGRTASAGGSSAGAAAGGGSSERIGHTIGR